MCLQLLMLYKKKKKVIRIEMITLYLIKEEKSRTQIFSTKFRGFLLNRKLLQEQTNDFFLVVKKTMNLISLVLFLFMVPVKILSIIYQDCDEVSEWWLPSLLPNCYIYNSLVNLLSFFGLEENWIYIVKNIFT